MKYFNLFIFLLLCKSIILCQEKTDTIKKSNELNEIVVTKQKKAVEQRADRTIFDFSEQPHLNSGTIMEGLKKLPGLIISEVAGMMYQGKYLEVYMDGKPLNIYSNQLNTFLESMPANSVDKVEIITQPGAEFPATSGGAIINIITTRNAKNHLSATYSNGFSMSNYDKNRHHFSNSILLNAKKSFLGWQLQIGQTYYNGFQKNILNNESIEVSNNFGERKNEFYYVKAGLKFDLKRDRILLNYDFSTFDSKVNYISKGYNFSSNDKSNLGYNRHDILFTYQKKFKTRANNLEFKINYNNNNNVFNYRTLTIDSNLLNTYSFQNYYEMKADFKHDFSFKYKTKFTCGVLGNYLDFNTFSFEVKNLNYYRSTLAGYSEIQSTFKQFDFIAGARIENYQIEGQTLNTNLNSFQFTKLFPNATIMYKIIPEIFVNANFNQKISLPNTATLNPNNTSYQNSNVTFQGNPNLKPTIFNNYELKLSAYEYCYLGYNISDSKNSVVSRYFSDSLSIQNFNVNIPNLSTNTFSFGLPLPYMLFTKGLKKTLEFDFNPDEINFLYFTTDYQVFKSSELESKGTWNFNFTSQIILPKKINFTATYNTSTKNGYYYFYQTNKPMNQQLDASLSSKFLSNKLSISIYFNDILNTNRQDLNAVGTSIRYNSKYDSRRIGFSLSYKIPTKNKIAKEDAIFLKPSNE